MTAAGWEKDDQPGFSVLQTSCNGPSRAATTGRAVVTKRPAGVLQLSHGRIPW